LKYSFPDIKNSSLAYKGRRFWIIEIANEDVFDDAFTKDDGDYIFYDAEYQRLYEQGFCAVISKTPSGTLLVTPTHTHVDMSYESESLKDVVRTLPKAMEEYLKTCFGSDSI
jgi:hypothetical protein